MLIQNIARIIVLMILMVSLLLASNKHGCSVRFYNKGSDECRKVVWINFWWALGSAAILSVLLWVGGFFG